MTELNWIAMVAAAVVVFVVSSVYCTVFATAQASVSEGAEVHQAPTEGIASTTSAAKW